MDQFQAGQFGLQQAGRHEEGSAGIGESPF
jgi:hypothetical protein